MHRSLIAPLALLLAATASSADAAPAASPETYQREMNELGAWLQHLNEIVDPTNAAISTLGPKIDTFSQTRDAAAVRAALAEARGILLHAQALLAAVPALHLSMTRAAGVDTVTILSDYRNQNAEMLKYLDDCDALVQAVEQRNGPAIQAAAPKLLRSSILLFDGRVLIYQSRQAALAPTRSVRQVLGVEASLYRTMSVVFRAWVQAKVDHQAELAVNDQRAKFLALAEELEATVRTGRLNAAREKSQLAAEVARGHGNRAVLDVDTRAGAIVASEEKVFVIGDQLARWLRDHAAMKAEELAAQQEPELIGPLADMEERLAAATRAQIDAVAPPPHS